MKTTHKKLSNYNKALLSVFVVSAITGGLVMLESYRNDQAMTKFNEEVTRHTKPTHVLSAEEHQAINSKIAINHIVTPIEESKAIIKKADEQSLNERPIEIIAATLSGSPESHPQALNKDDKVNRAPKAMIKSVDVLFELSSSALQPEYQASLIEMAQQIQQQGEDKRWQLVGHTDKSGHALYNLQLAQKRAQQVANFLIEQGVNEQQLTLVTLGEYEAEQRENSTYNQHLRRVQVSEYKPELSTLAVKLQTRYEKGEQQRLQKEALANVVHTATEEVIDDMLRLPSSPLTVGEDTVNASVVIETAQPETSAQVETSDIIEKAPLTSHRNATTQTVATLDDYAL